ncbi:tyrosine-type recombinase/integrase [Polyangium sorediatum]|uniref:Site-specific integrase n=1 Tax=Polyangium sorediatum TaxID=889274 RepID=A0ABT6P3N4_9BACT|nr:site-specific integrase [Polyangium sorediatum]MDI1435173.1 site-specific integrase [Polyangium sorediatum]
MPIRKVTRHGQTRLFIDIRYKTKDGQRARYRKDAQVQTLPGARAEEKRVLLNLARFGTPYAPEDDVPAPPVASPAGSPPTPSTTPALPTKTFSEVVSEYRSTFMLTDLKVTTRRGYALVLDRHLLPTFGERPLAQVDGAAAAELDLALSKQDRARATRNNVQIVLRSVLRFATSRGYLAGLPPALPRLKAAEKSILEIPSERDIDAILASAVPSQRLAFALMAYAGLRPNEVRALRRRDVLLPGTNGEVQGGFLSVREGRSYGETHTPKTGQREIPITAPLARLLEHVERGPKDGRVALNQQGKPWGQYGLTQAFERVRDRAGLGGWSVYGLRHFAITSWLRAGVPVHVVQRMAGHKHLSTTQRYVHHLKEDLAEAARRIAKATEGRGNGGATESGEPEQGRGDGRGDGETSHGPRPVKGRAPKG